MATIKLDLSRAEEHYSSCSDYFSCSLGTLVVPHNEFLRMFRNIRARHFGTYLLGRYCCPVHLQDYDESDLSASVSNEVELSVSRDGAVLGMVQVEYHWVCYDDDGEEIDEDHDECEDIVFDLTDIFKRAFANSLHGAKDVAISFTCNMSGKRAS